VKSRLVLALRALAILCIWPSAARPTDKPIKIGLILPITEAAGVPIVSGWAGGTLAPGGGKKQK